MRWTVAILSRIAIIAGLLVGYASQWYYGALLWAFVYGLILCARCFARCPRCGLAWTAEELDSFVCSRCRLNIGIGLRD